MKNPLSDVFPPKPTLTEKNLPDQSGKVFIVTGSSSGLGAELASMLYQHNAKVYIAARSEDKARKSIEKLQSLHPDSRGQLIFLRLDLNDLTTIKASADEFLKKEKRLDVLWNNAGVMVPPQGSKTAQGYELQLGTNNIAPFLFTKFLLNTIKLTAKSASPGSVRVVWVSSSAAEFAPKPAIDFENMDYKKEEGIWANLNPGNLDTDLQNTMPGLQKYLFKMITYKPVFGAYTQLFAGLDKSINLSHSGGWIAPFGKLGEGRPDLLAADLGRKYWDWTEEQIKSYL